MPTSVGTITITGSGGSSYNFNVYPLSALGSFRAFSCCYVFTSTSINPVLSNEIKYIGQTSDASSRLTPSHEKLPCVRRNGGLYVAVHATSYPVTTESDLLRKYNPVCNDS